MNKKGWKSLSQLFMGLSVASIVLAAVGYMVNDIWLASTQWLLVAALLALFGVYAKQNA